MTTTDEALRNPIRHSDLNANSTSYDFMVAAPPPQTLRLMWGLWVANQSVITLFCIVVFTGVVLSRKVRRNAFNCYLIFLMIPDIFMAGGCLAACAANLAAGHYRSLALCKFQSFNHIFGMTANAWLNAVIAGQMYKMLRASDSIRRYHPPKRRAVALTALKVYAYSAFVASWAILDIPWLPHGTSAANGMACVPVEENTADTIFLWLVFIPAFLGLPSAFVLYVAFKVWRGRLLPPQGRRRTLSVYFFRIIAVFIIMWIPTMITLYGMSSMWGKYPWFFWIIGSWTHYQGLLSAAVSLFKPDIKEAVWNFISCGVCSGRDISTDPLELDGTPNGIPRKQNSAVLTIQRSFRGLLKKRNSAQKKGEDAWQDEIIDDTELGETENDPLPSPPTPQIKTLASIGDMGQDAISESLRPPPFGTDDEEEARAGGGLHLHTEADRDVIASREAACLDRIATDEDERAYLDEMFMGSDVVWPVATSSRPCGDDRRVSTASIRQDPARGGLDGISAHTI